MFSRLHYGLAIILAFIGVKMLINPFYHIPSPVSLGIVGGVLIIAVVASLIWPMEEKEKSSLNKN
jgi:tellurite resistance protein TerC